MKKQWAKYLVRSLVMLILIALFFKWINIFESYTYFLSANWNYLFLAIGAIFFANIVKGFRFIFLTKAINLDLPFWKSFWVNSLTLIVGRITPAKLGEGIKVMYLDAKKTDLSFCFAMEKLGDLFTVFLFALLGITLFSEYLSTYILFGLVLLVGMFCLLQLDKVIKFFFKKDILEKKWFKTNLKKFTVSDWLMYVLLSFIVRIGVLMLPVLVNYSLGVMVPWLLVFEMYSIAIIVGNLSALPGGLGAREGSYTFLLNSHQGVSLGLAGVASLLITFVDLLVESILSLISYAVLKIKYK